MVTPAARREAVVHLRASLGVSERRACSIIGADRKSVRYRPRRGGDAALRGRLRELAQQRRRFGYRRLHILLLREGVKINRKRTQRLYTGEGLPRASASRGGARLAPARRCRWRRNRTSAGRSTSCMTSASAAGGFAC